MRRSHVLEGSIEDVERFQEAWVAFKADPSNEERRRAVAHAAGAAGFEQVLGDLESKAASARRAERSLAGSLARLFGLPAEVRGMIRANHGPGGVAQAGFWVTILTEVIAGVVLVAVLAGLAWAGLGIFAS